MATGAGDPNLSDALARTVEPGGWALASSPLMEVTVTGRELAVALCECTFVVRCLDDESATLIESVFSGLSVPQSASTIARRYTVARHGVHGFVVSHSDESLRIDDADSLLFYLDKDITLAVQHAHPDWFCLHAAAVGWNGRVAVLAAPAGTGKSTLTLAALNAGLEYLSDELAPVDLQRLTVQPFPHALCLKSPPPKPYVLPPGTRGHGRQFRVPLDALPSRVHHQPLPLAALIFLERQQHPIAGLRPMTAASAVARLMAHALNSLAHPGYGLDAALRLSRAVPCFQLDSTDLTEATALIKSVLSHQGSPSRTLPRVA